MELDEVKQLIRSAWPNIVEECREVLGGELHYQAVVYHCLRMAGCPRAQVGMNVKQMILEPVTELFRAWDGKKHEDFRGGFEPIPDVVLFRSDVAGDWRRRNYASTLQHMACAIEVKASEREKSRLGTAEIRRDIAKLAAHRDELVHRGGAMLPVMMVIDVAPLESERMRDSAVADCAQFAFEQGVAWLYASPSADQCRLEVTVPTVAP